MPDSPLGPRRRAAGCAPARPAAFLLASLALATLLVVPPERALGAGLAALVDVHQERTPRALALTAMAVSPYVDLFAREIAVEAGDILRLRSQIEMNNDSSCPVMGQIRHAVDGRPLGLGHGQVAVEGALHHLPLWADDVHVVPARGHTKVSAQYAATCAVGSAVVRIGDSAYGHLVIEHYRQLSLAAGSAYFLANAFQTRATLVESYGTGRPYFPQAVYRLHVPLAKGDLLRVLAQVTVHARSPTPLEMLGFGLFAVRGPRALADQFLNVFSPWAVENVDTVSRRTTLWTDAVYRALEPDTLHLAASLHGAYGNGAAVVPNGGHVLVLQFSRGGSPERDPRLQALGEAEVIEEGVIRTRHLVGSEWRTLLRARRHLWQGDRLRVTGYSQVAPRELGGRTVPCWQQLTVKAPGQPAAVSARSGRTVGGSRHTMLMRSEMLAPAPATGSYEVRLDVRCDDPRLLVHAVAWAPRLILDHFTRGTARGAAARVGRGGKPSGAGSAER